MWKCFTLHQTVLWVKMTMALSPRNNKYATNLSDTEFIKSTLPERNFCNLNTGLYHVDTTQWCVTAMFFKDNDRISKYCKLAENNITGPQAKYLDQGHLAISLEKSTQIELKCKDDTHVKTLQPLLTFITLQLVCSAFSLDIKLPPYFKQYSRGFHIALKSANLHVSKFTKPNSESWHTLIRQCNSCWSWKFKETWTSPSHSLWPNESPNCKL